MSIISFLFLSIPIGIRLYKYVDDSLIIDILDVGKGQSILIEHKNNRVIIDAGARTPYFDVGERILSPLLTYNAFPSLEYLILTHQDSDHIGGAVFLAKYYDIGKVYYNGDTTKETKTVQELFSHLQEKQVGVLEEGNTIELTEDVSLQVLFPNKREGNKKSRGGQSNAQSIVIMVLYKGKNIALLLGDIDIHGQEYLVKQYGNLLECKMIVLPHHGSRHNMYIPLYSMTKAQYAIASTDREDTNFVSSFMKESLIQHDIELYTTYRHGRIRYRYNNEGGTISFVREL
ncbi:MAG: MBL fold metallo-hydrolase [Desulfovibrionaceae bacterium]|nr:MBL fold metallo-hydrolase [Desulfovibrionaceae bacterium]